MCACVHVCVCATSFKKSSQCTLISCHLVISLSFKTAECVFKALTLFSEEKPHDHLCLKCYWHVFLMLWALHWLLNHTPSHCTSLHVCHINTCTSFFIHSLIYPLTHSRSRVLVSSVIAFYLKWIVQPNMKILSSLNFSHVVSSLILLLLWNCIVLGGACTSMCTSQWHLLRNRTEERKDVANYDLVISIKIYFLCVYHNFI